MRDINWSDDRRFGKSRGYPVGTIREWQGKKYQKQSSGEWKEVPKDKKPSGGSASRKELGYLKFIHEHGTLPPRLQNEIIALKEQGLISVSHKKGEGTTVSLTDKGEKMLGDKEQLSQKQAVIKQDPSGKFLVKIGDEFVQDDGTVGEYHDAKLFDTKASAQQYADKHHNGKKDGNTKNSPKNATTIKVGDFGTLDIKKLEASVTLDRVDKVMVQDVNNGEEWTENGIVEEVKSHKEFWNGKKLTPLGEKAYIGIMQASDARGYDNDRDAIMEDKGWSDEEEGSDNGIRAEVEKLVNYQDGKYLADFIDEHFDSTKTVDHLTDKVIASYKRAWGEDYSRAEWKEIAEGMRPAVKEIAEEAFSAEVEKLVNYQDGKYLADFIDEHFDSTKRELKRR